MLSKLLIAAERGDAEAQFMLGAYYHKGMSGTMDEAAAIRWYRKAAEQDYSEAQFALGVCYDNGHGVVGDAVEAYKWFLLAGAYENAPTDNFPGKLVAKITAEQTAEAKARVKKWTYERELRRSAQK